MSHLNYPQSCILNLLPGVLFHNKSQKCKPRARMAIVPLSSYFLSPNHYNLVPTDNCHVNIQFELGVCVGFSLLLLHLLNWNHSCDCFQPIIALNSEMTTFFFNLFHVSRTKALNDVCAFFMVLICQELFLHPSSLQKASLGFFPWGLRYQTRTGKVKLCL